MALVRDECLLPCRDAPELGYAKESSSEQYVPDVFYKASIDHFLSPLAYGPAEGEGFSSLYGNERVLASHVR